MSAGGDQPPAPDWRAVIDERLLARCTAHVRRGERLTRDWSVPIRARPPRLHLDPADWRTGFLRVERERDIPPALQDDLRQNMPQALLRDLYRPVRQERWIERELLEGTSDRGGHATMQSVRDARRLPTVPRIAPGVRAVIEYQTWRRTLLAERWQPLREEPR